MKSILDSIANKIKGLIPKNLLDLSAEDQKLVDALMAGRQTTRELAVAVLVSEIALCDLSFDKKEYDYLFSYFKKRFGLQDGEIRNLIHQGTQLMASLQTTEQFAEHLAETMDQKEREEILEMVKGLIAVDHLEHGFELYLFERLERLLGLASSPEEDSSSGNKTDIH